MLENFIQLDADKQHRIETFGEMIMPSPHTLAVTCGYYDANNTCCENPANKGLRCNATNCPLPTGAVQYNPEKIRDEQRQSIEDTLAQRGSTYGEFDSHALITQNIKRAMYASKNWSLMSDDKKECLEMVAHKIGRILNGNPEYKDSWHDIIGYVKLVDDTLGEYDMSRVSGGSRLLVIKAKYLGESASGLAFKASLYADDSDEEGDAGIIATIWCAHSVVKDGAGKKVVADYGNEITILVPLWLAEKAMVDSFYKKQLMELDDSVQMEDEGEYRELNFNYED